MYVYKRLKDTREDTDKNQEEKFAYNKTFSVFIASYAIFRLTAASLQGFWGNRR